MSEILRVDVQLLEKGNVHFRNAPPSVKVPISHWPREVCMCCNKALGGITYVGQAFQPVLRTRSIRLLSPGYFCDQCETISRAITSILQEWGLVVDSAEEWEVVIRRTGTIMAHVMHVSKDATVTNSRSFLQTVGSRLYRYMREKVLDSRVVENTDKASEPDIIDLTME